MFALLLCAAWILCYAYSRRRREAAAHRMPPAYPQSLPLIGHSHILLVWAKDIYGLVEKMGEYCLQSGGLTYGYFAGEIYYVITDPEDAVTVCNTALHKHSLYRFAQHFLGQGLLTSSGGRYKHHRKLLTPAFSSRVVNNFLDVFNKHCKLLVEALDHNVGKGPYDPVADFRNIMLRTSCITVFGDNDEKDSKFLNTYITTIHELTVILMERLEKVWLHNDFIFNFTKLKRRQDTLVKLLNDISIEVIRRRRDDWEHRKYIGNLTDIERPHQSFIDVVLEIAANGALTDLEIKDELNTAVTASYETTSQQLSYALAFVGTYPDVQQKVYQEVMEVVGDRDVDKLDVPRLVYLDAVIKESLRLVPTVPFLARYVDRDIELKNFTLRAGTNAVSLPGALHRNEAFWGVDADKFKPERWLDESMQTKLSKFSFAFSTGQRTCLGRRYAMVAIKVAMVHIVRNFTWKADHTKMKFKIDLLVQAVSGHEMTVERREPKTDSNSNVQYNTANQRQEEH